MNALLHPELLSASLGSHALFRCADDADETCWRVGQVFRPHRMGVLGRAQRLSAQMDHLRLARLSLNRLSYGASVTIASEPMDNFVMVFIPLAGVVDIRCGHQQVASTPWQPAVVSATQALDMRWGADCDVFILRIERDALDEVCAEQLGHALTRPIEFELAMDPQAEGCASWQSLIGFLTSSTAFTRQAAHWQAMARQLERLVASTLLLGHRHNHSEALRRPGVDAAPAYLRRAEDLMSRSSDQTLTVAALAAQVGVSERTLHAAFRQFRHATPMSAWKMMRLDQVRASLLAAARQGHAVTVAEVALAHGFMHLGHFARSYQARFHERPSHTLGRPAVDQAD